jgi:hypothetical protein
MTKRRPVQRACCNRDYSACSAFRTHVLCIKPSNFISGLVFLPLALLVIDGKWPSVVFSVYFVRTQFVIQNQQRLLANIRVERASSWLQKQKGNIIWDLKPKQLRVFCFLWSAWWLFYIILNVVIPLFYYLNNIKIPVKTTYNISYALQRTCFDSQESSSVSQHVAVKHNWYCVLCFDWNLGII